MNIMRKLKVKIRYAHLFFLIKIYILFFYIGIKRWNEWDEEGWQIKRYSNKWLIVVVDFGKVKISRRIDEDSK